MKAFRHLVIFVERINILSSGIAVLNQDQEGTSGFALPGLLRDECLESYSIKRIL